MTMHIYVLAACVLCAATICILFAWLVHKDCGRAARSSNEPEPSVTEPVIIPGVECETNVIGD